VAIKTSILKTSYSIKHTSITFSQTLKNSIKMNHQFTIQNTDFPRPRICSSFWRQLVTYLSLHPEKEISIPSFAYRSIEYASEKTGIKISRKLDTRNNHYNVKLSAEHYYIKLSAEYCHAKYGCLKKNGMNCKKCEHYKYYKYKLKHPGYFSKKARAARKLKRLSRKDSL